MNEILHNSFVGVPSISTFRRRWSSIRGIAMGCDNSGGGCLGSSGKRGLRGKWGIGGRSFLLQVPGHLFGCVLPCVPRVCLSGEMRPQVSQVTSPGCIGAAATCNSPSDMYEVDVLFEVLGLCGDVRAVRARGSWDRS